MRSIFSRQKTCSKILKKIDNIHLCYICNTKNSLLQIQHTFREPKKINLGMNSVKYYSPKADTIHNTIYPFCFSKSRLNFELIFFGVVDTVHKYVV
jgi:hypothetical protein